MGGFSPVHMGLVLVIALLVFGPKKLPEIGRELGQAIREFKKASREVMEGFHEGVEDRPPASPAYDPYSTIVDEAATPPHDAGPSLEAPPAAEGPGVPVGPPPGVVERFGLPATPPNNASAASPAAEPTPAPEIVPHVPEHSPAASERNS